MALNTITAQALGALGGMQIVVGNEMLVRQTYVTAGVVDHELADSGALCGGHQACAIGSFLIGAGVKPTENSYGDWSLTQAFTMHYDRGEDRYVNARELFLNEPGNEGLLLAYNALNAAAQDMAADRGINLHRSRLLTSHSTLEIVGALEAFFEFDSIHITDANTGHKRLRKPDEYTLSRFDLLKIIQDAVQLVLAENH